MTFKIGTTLLGLQALDDIFEISETADTDPDWSYKPFSQYDKIGNGQTRGQGYPVVKWRWNGIADVNREILKAFVGADLSATVFIETKISETYLGEVQWGQFECTMNWPTEDEDFQAGNVLSFILIFTHMVPQS